MDINLVREPNPIIPHYQPRLLGGIGMQFDVHFTGAVLGKGIFEGIAQQLIENEPAGDRLVNV